MSEFKQVPDNIKKDLGTFLDEMIENLAKEIDAPIIAIMQALSKRYRIAITDIKESLKIVESKFTMNNNVVYWDHNADKFVKRTNHLAKVTSTMRRIGHDLQKEDSDMSAELVFPYIENALLRIRENGTRQSM